VALRGVEEAEMGMRGPAATPTALKALRGGKDAVRGRENEVTGPSGVPEPPEYLSRRAREVWDYTVRQLIVMQVLTLADRDPLAIYCTSVANYEEAVQVLNLEGPVVEGRDGGFVKNPVAQVVRDQALLVKLMAAQFGLTPSSRVGLTPMGEAPSKAGPERLLS
jgi:P27 family predicted phage terminase small subunit